MEYYEVSLGDTTGTGNPTSVGEMLNVALGANPVEGWPDTYAAPSVVASSFF
jgi:hypothetical protein